MVKLRERVQIDCSTEQKKVVQKHKTSCDINFIVEQYRKTGTFPSPLDRQALYLDTTAIPDLASAMTVVSQARQAFMELPSPLRKLMDNDPTKLEAFISDAENYEILKKYGVVEERKQPIKEPAAPNAALAKPEGAAASKKANSAPKTSEED